MRKINCMEKILKSFYKRVHEVHIINLATENKMIKINKPSSKKFKL